MTLRRVAHCGAEELAVSNPRSRTFTVQQQVPDYPALHSLEHPPLGCQDDEIDRTGSIQALRASQPRRKATESRKICRHSLRPSDT
jgi:hypothetical protein